MKVLWFSVTPVQSGLRALGIENDFHGGGWIDSLLKAMPMGQKNIELKLMFLMWGIDTVLIGESKDNAAITYVAVPSATPRLITADNRMEMAYKQVLDAFHPDLVHIFGTETVHSNILLRLAGPEKCLFSLTGVISRFVYHYFGGIREELRRTVTIRDVLRGSAFKNYRQMKKQTLTERDTLRHARHVSGRTAWDKAAAELENPNVQYWFCNENLRDAFYQKQWSWDDCQRYSIFSSSSASALKGAHKLLQAMPLILQAYPQTQLYLTGNDPRSAESLVERIRLTGYQKYLARLIKRLKIDDAVHFTGPLSEGEMAQRCVSANVYVLPSNIENSPNSLCEAMLMGVPSVAACVGGVPDLLCSGEEGFLYPFEEYYMLAYRVMQIFADRDLAERLSDSARKRAADRHDRVKNGMVMAQIYEQILEQENRHA